MSRPRKPTRMLELSGAFDRNPQRRKAREHEPSPTGPLGDPPTALDEAQRARWNEIRAKCPWLGESDDVLVEVTCKLWMEERRGKCSPGDRKLLVQCLRALGMAPGERSRMVKPATTPKTKLSRFA